MDRVIPSSLGHYTILLVSKDLLPEGSPLSNGKSVVYISQYRHSLIGTGPGTACTGQCINEKYPLKWTSHSHMLIQYLQTWPHLSQLYSRWLNLSTVRESSWRRYWRVPLSDSKTGLVTKPCIHTCARDDLLPTWLCYRLTLKAWDSWELHKVGSSTLNKVELRILNGAKL